MDDTDVSGVVEQDLNEKQGNGISDDLPKTHEELNRLIGEKKLKERDRTTRELEAKHQAELQKLQAERDSTRQAQSTPTQSANPGVDVNEAARSEVQKILEQEREKAAKAQRDAEMQRVADAYFSKLKSGADKYDDFDDMVAELDHAEFPQLVHAIHGFDNMADMMYELANDPRKFEKINAWLRNMPERGLKELKKLSDSLRENSEAFNEYEPTAEPLSETKPSNVGASSGLSKLEQAKQKYRF